MQPKSNTIIMGSSMDELETFARRYAELGLPVVLFHTVDDSGRCSCGNEECPLPGAHPDEEHGGVLTSTDPEAVGSWYVLKERNVGLRVPPGYIVLKTYRYVVDDDEQSDDEEPVFLHGEDTLQELGLDVPATWTARCDTAVYRWYRTGEDVSDLDIPHVGYGVTTLGKGRFVPAPPSEMPTGRLEWEPGKAPWECPIAEAPEWLRPKPRPENPRPETPRPQCPVPVLDDALRYAEHGLAVFPLKMRDKVPVTSNGFKDATRDKEQIELWFADGDLNIGIALPEHIVVLDIDRHGDVDGWETVQKHGLELPLTWRAVTGGNGSHFWFRLPDGVRSRSTKRPDMPGIDIKGHGGYVVVPPSVHPSGVEYRWLPGAAPWECELAEAPEWLVAQLTEAPKHEPVQAKRNGHGNGHALPAIDSADLAGLSDVLAGHWRPGIRHDLALAVAGWLRKRGVEQEEAERIISEAAGKAGDYSQIPQHLRAVRDTYSKALNETAGWEAINEIDPKLAAELDEMFPMPRDEQETWYAKAPAEHHDILQAMHDQRGVRGIRLREPAGVIEVLTDGRWECLTDPMRKWLAYCQIALTTDNGDTITRLVSPARTNDAIEACAHAYRYNLIEQWMRGLPVWDGHDHIGDLARHIKHDMPALPDGSDPVERFLRKWLVGCFARLLGREENFVPILIGGQGIGKSWLIRWLAPKDLLFSGGLNPDDKDHLLLATQKLIWELDELQATTARRDVAALKGLLTRQELDIRRPYARSAETLQLTASFIATANGAYSLLYDRSGNRRFVALDITQIDWGYTNIPVDQLWAQALHLYQSGFDHRLSAEEATWRDEQNEPHTSFADDVIEHWVDEAWGAFVDQERLQQGTICIEANAIIKAAAAYFDEKKRAVAQRISDALKRRGFRSANLRFGGRQTWCYVRPGSADDVPPPPSFSPQHIRPDEDAYPVRGWGR